MIERYSRPEMAAIWTEENKLRNWMEIEITVCEVRADRGEIPKTAAKIIRDKATFDLKKVLEIEETVKHDVIAFLTNLNSYIGEPSRFIHQGMTSSDILDTGLSLQMVQAHQIILNGLISLRTAIGNRAKEFKHTIQIGRSHGIHAEPISFGHKLAIWYDEMSRHIDRFQALLPRIAVGKISGAVGTFQHLDPAVEEETCKRLSLSPAPASSQVIQRDRHAEFISVLALIASSLDKFATEIRHLQRTEVLEAEEFFSKGQKGSSAMPHKRNPIISERISGMARIIRGNSIAALENIALWHERDISHSSVERVILPDSTILLDYMLAKMTGLIENLIVYPDHMIDNLAITNGLYYSQTLLIALTNKGITREDAYLWVQRNAMKTWETKQPFKDYVLADSDIMSVLSEEEIETMLNLDATLRHVDHIFKRVGLE